jgi:hypothetical protein
MEKNGRFLQEGLVRLSSDKDVSAPIMVYVAGSKKLCANLVIEALYGFQFLARYHYSLLLLIILALIKSWCRQLLISVLLVVVVGELPEPIVLLDSFEPHYPMTVLRSLQNAFALLRQVI